MESLQTVCAFETTRGARQTLDRISKKEKTKQAFTTCSAMYTESVQLNEII